MDLTSVSANQLAKLCSDPGSREAWSEFVRRFQRPIALVVFRTARRWGAQPAEVIEDLVQETFLRLCADNSKLLRSFVSRDEDSIVGYLKVIATNITHDHFRSEMTMKRGGNLAHVPVDRDDMDLSLMEPGRPMSAECAVQMDEIDRTLRSFVPDVLTDRDCTIFWLYYQQGFSARDIGEIKSIGLTMKGVESSIHRATKQVREALGRPALIAAQAAATPKGIRSYFPFLRREEG